MVAKIADLDTARLQPNNQLSVHSSTRKTLQWTAPELFRGKMVTKKVDVYSLSIIIWEILTQKSPWDGLNEFEVMGNIFNGLRPDIPAHASSHVRIMLEKGWANNPDNRLDAQDVADALQEELDRHHRALLKDAHAESGSMSGFRDLNATPSANVPLKSVSEVTDRRKRSHTDRNPSSPLARSRTHAEIKKHEEEHPPPRQSMTLTRKASLMFDNSANARLSQGLRRTRSIDNMHPFVTIPLTPPTPKRAAAAAATTTPDTVADNTNPNAAVRIGLRADSRTDNRSDSRSDSRDDSRSDSRSDSSYPTSRTDNTESPGEKRTEHRVLSSKGNQSIRTLKRSDSNPNVKSTLLQRTLRRAESVQSIANLKGDSRGRSGSLGDIGRPDSSEKLRNNFMFTRSDSGVGLKYQISSIPEDDAPRVVEKLPVATSSPTNQPIARLYNHDGYNTGEIHKETVNQFNVNYLDDYIDHINYYNPPNNPPNLPPSLNNSQTITNYSNPTEEQREDQEEQEDDNDHEGIVAGLPTIKEEEVKAVKNANPNGYDAPTKITYEDREDEEEGEKDEYEEDYGTEPEAEELEVEAEVYVEEQVMYAHDTSISYEVNGDEEIQVDDADEERRQKEEQERYTPVYSGDPANEDSERDLSSSFSASGSFRWLRR